MTNVPYNTNIPFASNTPSQDQPRMQENTNSLKALIEFDHVGFGNTEGGYHTVIHQSLQPGPPANIVGVNQIFSMVPPSNIPSGGDTQLFSLSGNGGLSQLTGASVALVDGFQWIGNALLQWGTLPSNSSVTRSVSFPVVFPTSTLNIQVTSQRVTANPGSDFQFYVDNTTITTSGFDILNRSGHSYGYFWLAIGA